MEKLLKSTASSSAHGDSSVTNEFKAQVDPNALAKQRVVIIATTNHLEQVDSAVIDRIGDITVKLPPLDDAQRAELLKRQLPADHTLSNDQISTLVSHIQGGSVRLLQGLARKIVNSACDATSGARLPVTYTHVQEAIAMAEDTAAHKAQAQGA